MVEVILGINNGFALKRWPEPETWAEVVGRDLGVRCVQLSFDLLDPAWPQPCLGGLCQRVRVAADRYSLDIPSTFTGLVAYAQNLLAHPEPGVREHARGWFELALEVTAALGARSTGGHMGALSARDHADPSRRAGRRRTLIEHVRWLSQKAAALGLESLLWESMPVPREIPHTPEEAITLLEEVNEGAAVPVRLCFDLGHCCAWDLESKGDPHAWLESLLPWTAVIHLQQTDGQGDRHWPFTRGSATQGIVSPARVVEIVRASPLETVHLFLEICHPHEAPDRQVIDDLKESVDAWAKVM